LLFAIVVGKLPFWNNDIPRLFNTILNEPVRCPPFLSPPLVDLINKLLCKDPRQRITLQGIRRHPWLAQTDCLALIDKILPKANARSSLVIDRDAVDRMAALGIDCDDLPYALGANEFTDLTALYRMYIREKTTERLKELQQNGTDPTLGKAPIVRHQKPASGILPPSTTVLPFTGIPAVVLPLSATVKRDSRKKTARPVVVARRAAIPCTRPAAPDDG
jgi:serine/threonine protein kinase